jgi:hypothetical protein
LRIAAPLSRAAPGASTGNRAATTSGAAERLETAFRFYAMSRRDDRIHGHANHRHSRTMVLDSRDVDPTSEGVMRCLGSIRTWAVIGVLVVLSACATAPAPPTVSEPLLVQAGFKTLPARTELQQQHLQALQQDAVSEMQQTGRHYYVYPDVANRRLYVGTPREYEKYLALRTRDGLPNPPPPASASADMQQYLKRDTAMMRADGQKVEAYPWTLWPDFAIALEWTP